MACHGCGSDGLTRRGKNCVSCPWCCKVKRCQERKRGRWDRPKGEPFRKSTHKAPRRKTQRIGDSCVNCGSTLRRTQRKYCCSACFYEARKSGRQEWNRSRQIEGCYHRGGKWNNSISKKWVEQTRKCWDWVREAAGLFDKMQVAHQSQRPCDTCGTLCDPPSRFCSRACAKSWRGTRECKCGRPAHNARAHGRVSCVTCKRESRRIEKRLYGSYRRRCRTYGGHFNKDVKPTDVFVRDGWRCHICLRRTHKLYRATDELSATVDHHPIPLSKGGDHDWHNVRCACRRCNELKGNRWNGQRRLALTD